MQPVPLIVFRAVYALFVDIIAAVDLPVAQLFFDVRAGHLQGRDAIYRIDCQTKAVIFVLNRQFQRGVNTAFFLVAAHVQS